MTNRLAVAGSVTLNGAGAGSVTLGPGRQSEQWTVARYSTRGASAVEPALQVFRGAGMVDSTKRGNADISEASADLTLWGGETLTFAYTGGTAGAVMFVYVEGSVDYGSEL